MGGEEVFSSTYYKTDIDLRVCMVDSPCAYLAATDAPSPDHVHNDPLPNCNFETSLHLFYPLFTNHLFLTTNT